MRKVLDKVRKGKPRFQKAPRSSFSQFLSGMLPSKARTSSQSSTKTKEKVPLLQAKEEKWTTCTLEQNIHVIRSLNLVSWGTCSNSDKFAHAHFWSEAWDRPLHHWSVSNLPGPRWRRSNYFCVFSAASVSSSSKVTRLTNGGILRGYFLGQGTLWTVL